MLAMRLINNIPHNVLAFQIMQPLYKKKSNNDEKKTSCEWINQHKVISILIQKISLSITENPSCYVSTPDLWWERSAIILQCACTIISSAVSRSITDPLSQSLLKHWAQLKHWSMCLVCGSSFHPSMAANVRSLLSTSWSTAWTVDLKLDCCSLLCRALTPVTTTYCPYP